MRPESGRRKPAPLSTQPRLLLPWGPYPWGLHTREWPWLPGHSEAPETAHQACGLPGGSQPSQHVTSEPASPRFCEVLHVPSSEAEGRQHHTGAQSPPPLCVATRHPQVTFRQCTRRSRLSSEVSPPLEHTSLPGVPAGQWAATEHRELRHLPWASHCTALGSRWARLLMALVALHQ